jgi:hypothetical protein
MNTPLVVLNGWKEIAKYLGTSVRSVQRYERGGGLPVRRPSRQSRGAVLATRAELDAWVNASPLKDALSLKQTCAQNHIVAFETFKTSLAEHRRLREGMTRGKKDLQKTVELLRATLVVVHDGSAGKFER